MLAIYDEIRVNSTSLKVVGKGGLLEAMPRVPLESKEPQPQSALLLYEFLRGDVMLGKSRSNYRLLGRS